MDQVKFASVLALGVLLAAVSVTVLGCKSVSSPRRASAAVPAPSSRPSPPASRIAPLPKAPPRKQPPPFTAARKPALLDLMPYPVSLVRTGGDLRLHGLPLVVENGAPDPKGKGGGSPTSPRVDFALSLLRQRIIDMTGKASTGPVRLVLDWQRTATLSVDEKESYSLVVGAGEIKIDAPTDLGILHGIATLSQLLSREPDAVARLPQVVIHDHPRFRWRGLMLDCVRHFMPVATVERTLLGMAAVKLNVFHWHLTDDQGVRIQSMLFPRLTDIGSNGQYYTQKQVREVVHFANLLGIRVVPEFDMPAHTSAVLAAYPSLAAGKGPYHVQASFGVFNDVMDPTRASTYRAIRDFLGEMVKLFPDRYVHIGGDENNFREWSDNPRIRAFMRAHDMTSYSQLSQYFTSRVEEILKDLGRRAVTWEEAWNGSRDPGSAVQVWANPDLVRKAVAVGQRVIRSQRYYLDLLYPASYHYTVDPADDTGNDSAVLGGEAAMWTELVSPANLASRLWPRLAAIAERFWSPASRRSVEEMYARLPSIDDYLAAIGMRQRSDERRILDHLAGGRPNAALRTLASVLEPLKGYGRISAMHYTTGTPLDRMVDAIPPESVAARQFRDVVGLILDGMPLGSDASAQPPPPIELPVVVSAQSRARRAAFQEARQMLELWMHNDARLQGLFVHQKDLHELAGVSADLTLVAVVGLAALDRLARYPAGMRPIVDVAWLNGVRETLRGTQGSSRAQVTIAIEAPVLRLVYAACGLEPPLRG